MPQTHFVTRGSIPQRVSNWERSNMNLNTALELLLPQTHLSGRGSIFQRVSNWERSNKNLNTALELLFPGTFYVQRQHSPTILHWPTCGLRNTTLRWSYFCLRHTRELKQHAPTQFQLETCQRETHTALKLHQLQTNFVNRGSISEQSQKGNVRLGPLRWNYFG